MGVVKKEVDRVGLGVKKPDSDPAEVSENHSPKYKKGKKRGHGQPGRSGPPGNKNAMKHGLHSMKRTIKELGTRAIDGRSKVGRALMEWRAEIIADLGGPEAVTTAQEQVIELAVRTKLMLDSIDAYVLENGRLVNKKKRCLFPVVKERQQLADGLARYLNLIGLERRSKPVQSLTQYLAEAQNTSGSKTEPVISEAK